MLLKTSIFTQRNWKTARFAASGLLAFFIGGSLAPVFAQQPGQRTFASAQEAGHALFTAMRAQSDQPPLNVLGSDAKDILSSSDPSEDSDARVGFVVKYQEMHRFVREQDGTVTLVIGAENWPFPIPLVDKNGSWYFDTPAGKDEIVFRRIGSNEFAAIAACKDLAEAQKKFSVLPYAGVEKQFAQKLVSDEGRHNGLYWFGAYNEFDSPLSSLIAHAQGKDAKDVSDDQVPFNGYFFRILTSQGPHAPGGAKNYVVKGKMTGGFAFVAYPADYRSSGVMTFIIDESGTIFAKDLGPNTSKLAENMAAYDPDSTWQPAE